MKMRSSGGNSLAVTQEFQQLQKEIDTVLTITKSMRFSPGLYLALSNSFSCSIYLDIHPPVIFARCCKNLLGCESCVDICYSGENGSLKTCPICRSERDFPETCQVNRLGDFLEASPLPRTSYGQSWVKVKTMVTFILFIVILFNHNGFVLMISAQSTLSYQVSQLFCLTNLWFYLSFIVIMISAQVVNIFVLNCLFSQLMISAQLSSK